MTQRLNAMRAAIQADPARRRRVERLVQRLERRQRRLAIARRRERIATQPRVGDTIIDDLGWVSVVEGRHGVLVKTIHYHRITGLGRDWYQWFPLVQWREMVRRARSTQEGSAHE